MLRGIYGDPDRYQQEYWSRFPGVYFTGDGARRDEDGYFWLLGRVDDVMNVAGHRIGTMEVESALVAHPAVAEAAVIGMQPRDQGPGAGGVRDAQGGQRSDDGAMVDELRRSTSPTRSARSPSPTHPLHGRTAQDPQREDHAPAAARHRGRPSAGRHHHPGRPHGRPEPAASGTRKRPAGRPRAATVRVRAEDRAQHLREALVQRARRAPGRCVSARRRAARRSRPASGR